MKRRIFLMYGALILIPFLLFSVGGYFVMHGVDRDILQGKELLQDNVDREAPDDMLESEEKPLSRIIRARFRSAGLMFFASYLVIHLLFMAYVLRSVLQPLEKMKDAAHKIRDGNLDFGLQYEKKDEIGEVFAAFEEMRSKLQEAGKIQIQYERNRKEMIANISHDLKTPLTAIKGHVEGIMDKVANTPTKVDSYCRTIFSYAKSMDRLIDDLFMFSQLDTAKMHFEFESIDIVTYLDDCFDEWYYDLKKKNISLRRKFEYSSGQKVKADREQIKRVLNNIINNAVKQYNKGCSQIEIILQENAKHCIITVKDDGAGIPAEKVGYIFDRFFKVDEARSVAGGTGLGLAIAKQIVVAHGGEIWVESSPGVGTAISFILEKVGGDNREKDIDY